MSSEEARRQTPETFGDILASMPNLSPVTAQTWERERSLHMSRYPDSIFQLTPQLGKKGLTNVIHNLVRKGLGTKQALAEATEETLFEVVGMSATPLSKKLALALRNEAIARIATKA